MRTTRFQSPPPSASTSHSRDVGPISLNHAHIGFVSARSAHFGDPAVMTDPGLGRLIDALAGRCARMTVALSSVESSPASFNHELRIPSEDCLPMPYLPSLARGFSRAAACRRVLRQVEVDCDIVLVQLPFAAPLALHRAGRPRLYHLCADGLRQVGTSTYYRGHRRYPALFAARAVDRFQRHLFRRSAVRVVTNGAALFDHYDNPPGRWVVSSALRANEIGSASRSRPDDAPFRVLFVGYLRHEKGVDLLVETFERLLTEKPEAELRIVGDVDMVDSGALGREQETLRRLIERGRVHVAGHIPFGPDLYQAYADADVLVLTSRSEGTPRVLIEARAVGCPVVATAVGGVPSSVQDGVDGLLVPPDDPPALTAALLRIADDKDLRARLVEAGYTRARQTTVESFADQIAEEMEILLNTTHESQKFNRG